MTKTLADCLSNCGVKAQSVPDPEVQRPAVP